MALTKKQLDAAMCQEPGCDNCGPLVLSGRCHPGQPTVAVYDRGNIFIECSVCSMPVTSIAVADQEASN